MYATYKKDIDKKRVYKYTNTTKTKHYNRPKTSYKSTTSQI